MSILELLIAAGVTAFLVYLIQQGKVTSPFDWICYAVIVVMWIVVLARLLGFGGSLGTVG